MAEKEPEVAALLARAYIGMSKFLLVSCSKRERELTLSPLR